mgnify:CR=1 FL=1
MARIGLVLGVAAIAAAAAGCGNRRAQLQAQANERRILELSDENHQLGQQLAANHAQVAALQAQVASLQAKLLELMRQDVRIDAPPLAVTPVVKPAPVPAPIDVPKALRDKGVQAVERDGRTVLLDPVGTAAGLVLALAARLGRLA